MSCHAIWRVMEEGPEQRLAAETGREAQAARLDQTSCSGPIIFASSHEFACGTMPIKPTCKVTKKAPPTSTRSHGTLAPNHARSCAPTSRRFTLIFTLHSLLFTHLSPKITSHLTAVSTHCVYTRPAMLAPVFATRSRLTLSLDGAPRKKDIQGELNTLTPATNRAPLSDRALHVGILRLTMHDDARMQECHTGRGSSRQITIRSNAHKSCTPHHAAHRGTPTSPGRVPPLATAQPHRRLPLAAYARAPCTPSAVHTSPPLALHSYTRFATTLP